MMIAAARAPTPDFSPLPPEIKRIDMGSYATSWSRLHSALGWSPLVVFADGVHRTLDFYKNEVSHYLKPDNLDPACPPNSPRQ